MEGRIYKILANFYYVKVNNDIYECMAKGKFKNEQIDLLVGDIAQIEIDDYSKYKANIVNVKQRKNKLIRPSVANVDKLIITLSIVEPKPDLVLLDKELIYCKANNIIPIICITKIDKDEDEEAEKIKNIYETIGYKVYLVSNIDKSGINDLKKELKGYLCVLAGNSGIGKSTLINNLCDQKLMQEGDISKKILRGKHTTRHAEIFTTDGFMIADTPGFSVYDVININKNEIAQYFIEFEKYIDKCEFRDCTHIKEEKCAIKKAIRDGEIFMERYNRYIEIYNELTNKRGGK